jgi:predicted ATPase/DNA-binding CsgD family transcriptional regulator
VAGESLWRVPSLSVPRTDRLTDAGEVTQYEALRLFVERARLRLPAFSLTSDNAYSVAKVCRKLEGMPLAIELATARMGTLTVEQISERLEDPLKLLSGGPRTAAGRQRTMRATLEWSYELLEETERKLFHRLSVFAGGWTLGAAEAVGAGGGIEEGDVLDLLSRLVDKSLVTVEALQEMGGEPRYRVLEPVRQYARERLEASGEPEETGHRHALWCLRFAEEAEEGLDGSEHAAWIRWLKAEHDNLRTALRWSVDRGEAELGLRLAAALWPFWFDNGHSIEGRGWLEKAIALGGPPAARAKALNGAGYITTFQNDYGLAKAFLEESLALYRELEDEEGVASSLTHLGFFALLGQRDDVPVVDVLEEALKLRPRIKNLRTIANMLTLVFIGTIAGLTGKDLEDIVALHEEGLVRFREAKYAWGMKTCLTNLGMIALARGESVRAKVLFRDLLLLSRELDEKIAGLHAFFGLACAAALEGNPARAARLWAVTEGMQESTGTQLPPTTRSFAAYESRLADAHAQLGEATVEEAWVGGKAMTEREAVEYALATEQEAPSPVTSAPEQEVIGEQLATLTHREWEVAELVARGLTNRRIAGELHIAERTVTTHVGRILKKLGLRSREQVAARMTGQQRPHGTD